MLMVRQYVESFARAALLIRILPGKKSSSWTSIFGKKASVGKSLDCWIFFSFY